MQEKSQTRVPSPRELYPALGRVPSPRIFGLQAPPIRRFRLSPSSSTPSPVNTRIDAIPRPPQEWFPKKLAKLPPLQSLSRCTQFGDRNLQAWAGTTQNPTSQNVSTISPNKASRRELPQRVKVRSSKYLNKLIEQATVESSNGLARC